MSVHELKCDPVPFVYSSAGLKPFEIRKNDRDFKTHDVIVLNETVYSAVDMANGFPLQYTGNSLRYMITSVFDGYGLGEGFVVLGLMALRGRYEPR